MWLMNTLFGATDVFGQFVEPAEMDAESEQPEPLSFADFRQFIIDHPLHALSKEYIDDDFRSSYDFFRSHLFHGAALFFKPLQHTSNSGRVVR